MTYFVIASDHDGVHAAAYTEDELRKKLTPDEHGLTDWGTNFTRRIPDDGVNLTLVEDSVLIIKGELIVPEVSYRIVSVVSKINL